MRVLLLVAILMAGCANTSPITTTVSRTQEFEFPPKGTIAYEVVDVVELKMHGCGVDAIGCVTGVGTDHPKIWIGDYPSKNGNKYTFDHECQHVIFGPKHIREQ